MNQNTYILVGLCIFFLLLGTRLKKYLNKNKDQKQAPLKKNQRTKAAKVEYPSGRYRNRERVKRIFTYIVIGVLFVLVMFMIPSLVHELYLRGFGGMNQNLFMRIVIIIAATFTMISSFITVRKKKEDKTQK
jgi:hypothetical protein